MKIKNYSCHVWDEKICEKRVISINAKFYFINILCIYSNKRPTLKRIKFFNDYMKFCSDHTEALYIED